MLITERLLTWYDQNRRVLPWRARPGERADPYRVWLSEIMLQQTTVATVTPYFRAFLNRWPTITDLARAPRDDVLTAWAGLGYYARAHNLHKCAQILVATRDATFPTDAKILRKLPGIGSYTAAAISAIAFGQRAVAVDSNVERLITRLFAITEFPSVARSRIIHIADMLTPNCRCGDFIQAAMDLGAILCRSRKPSCRLCPLHVDCAGYQKGTAESLPVRRNERLRERQTRHGIVFFAVSQEGAILLCRRPQKGLLGGMMGMPSTPWRIAPWQLEDAVLTVFPFLSWSWQLLPGSVRHTFTHFKLDLRVAYGHGILHPTKKCAWVTLEKIETQPLPSVMRKALMHAADAICAHKIASSPAGDDALKV